MFGRSGQMFPRQRAFHDAIYEEEYGSDHEEECCQSRGMSAIFCWFLSVIILIGIAASIVLTVFFILKSKNYISKGELDSFDGDQGLGVHFLETTTELNNIDFPISASSSKESVQNSNSDEDDQETENNRFGERVSTTTRFPPSRKGPSEMFSEEKTSSYPPRYRNPYDPNDFTASREGFRPDSRPQQSSEEAEPANTHSKTHRDETSSSEEEKSSVLTTTEKTPGQHVLFTSPPDAPTATATTYRRNLQTTRFPTGRTSFTTSTEALEEHENSDRNNNDHDQEDENGDTDSEASNGHRPPQNSENNDETSVTTQEDTATASTNNRPSKEREVDVVYKSEESQLNKMLLDEIPPHKEIPMDNSKSTEFNLPSKESNRRDPLARIIKNLAPKWGRNRTIETTTMTSGNHKYDFTISSKEKDRTNKDSGEKSTHVIVVKERQRESSTRSTFLVTPETIPTTTNSRSSEFQIKLGGRRGNTDQPINILNTIQSPNLSRRKDENADADNPFLDILVGSEDHKTLITKQTEDGIVTSAILPPWYDTAGGNPNNATRNSTNSNSKERKDKDEDDGSNESEKQSAEESASTSVFGGLLDFFKKLPGNINKNRNQEEYNPKRIVLKRPGGELMAQGSSHVAHSSEGDNNINTLANINTIKPSNVPPSTTTSPLPDNAVVTDDIFQANNAFHYGSPDGGTNIYGYYPDEEAENDKTVEHHVVQSENMSDELIKKVQRDPSHSIELQINSDGSSEVVIEHDADKDDYHYSRYGEAHAGSAPKKQVVQSPFHGGGIRRPISKGPAEDLEAKGSENRPVFANNIRNIPSQLMRQRPTNATKTKGDDLQVAESQHVSEEMVDNSAERDPRPNRGGGMSTEQGNGSYAQDEGGEEDVHKLPEKNQEQGIQVPGSGSYENESGGSGSGEGPAKWSKPDSSIFAHSSNEKEALPPTGSEELKVNPNSGDENDVLERRPVVQLDEKLYPDSADTSGSAGAGSTESKVHHVFPVGYSTTTERPDHESTISEPEKHDDENSSKGFVAPTPVNFHENKYTFSAPSSDSMYQSKDGWRPLVYNDEDNEEPPKEAVPAPVQQQTHWRNVLPGMTRRPTHGPTSSPHYTPPTTSLTQVHSNQNLDEEEYEQEIHKEDNASDEHVESNGNISWGEREHQHQNQQGTQIVGSQVKFPEPHHSQEMNRNQNYQNGAPMQPHHQRHPNQMSPHHQNQHPQQVHHHRQPFQFPNNPNIDRSKYMIRPATPPIVMRRAPIQSMPYLANRTLPPRPQLIPQIQQNQFNNNAHPTEFPHPPPLVNRRRFKNLGPRPRGNVNWPSDENRKVDTAERRNG